MSDLHALTKHSQYVKSMDAHTHPLDDVDDGGCDEENH